MLKALYTSVLPLVLATTSVPGFTMHMQEKTVTLQDQKQLGVTIYNENLALIRDLRQVPLKKGINRLVWREVSAQIRPQTALLHTPGQPAGSQLLEQNFDFDLLTPEKLLESYLGRTVNIIYTNPVTGKETTEAATVLSTRGGVVLKFADRIETGTTGRITFPDIPDHLHDRPTLSLVLESASQSDRELELSYLTSGLSWQADYVAELNTNDDRIDLSGLITLANHSGITYPNAHLQLVAGNINQISSEQPQTRKMMAMVADAAEYQKSKEEPLFEYHLYTMPATTTLAENQTKQVILMSAADIPVSREFLLRGIEAHYLSRYTNSDNKLRPDVFIQFENKGKGLDKPLPGGIVRAYIKDSQDNTQFLGEDHIDHIAKNDPVRVKLGKAFDITATRIQTDFQQLDTPSQRFTETAHKIEIHNTRQEAVTIRVQEPIPGDWIIISESFPHTRPAANLAEWKITIPVKEKIVLSYRVRIKH
ncbi:DUF4139 domain-containing protein [Nitrosomonas sp. HPC101]|uniref:DUF4139 domain-containing protein n=1 Tax=Nitrosomonas sp. HPC101 TaxID=1658667 RepID=UPI00136C524C|nr:DUF4139 domain-containing protein [Nitrosomonas sp. HPC101]MXS85738.1 DUF4139 domain-containing protein [Nitrosomonas sp. HPC101]